MSLPHIHLDCFCSGHFYFLFAMMFIVIHNSVIGHYGNYIFYKINQAIAGKQDTALTLSWEIWLGLAVHQGHLE
jgi:hypothetical protein